MLAEAPRNKRKMGALLSGTEKALEHTVFTPLSRCAVFEPKSKRTYQLNFPPYLLASSNALNFQLAAKSRRRLKNVLVVMEWIPSTTAEPLDQRVVNTLENLGACSSTPVERSRVDKAFALLDWLHLGCIPLDLLRYLFLILGIAVYHEARWHRLKDDILANLLEYRKEHRNAASVVPNPSHYDFSPNNNSLSRVNGQQANLCVAPSTKGVAVNSSRSLMRIDGGPDATAPSSNSLNSNLQERVALSPNKENPVNATSGNAFTSLASVDLLTTIDPFDSPLDPFASSTFGAEEKKTCFENISWPPSLSASAAHDSSSLLPLDATNAVSSSLRKPSRETLFCSSEGIWITLNELHYILDKLQLLGCSSVLPSRFYVFLSLEEAEAVRAALHAAVCHGDESVVYGKNVGVALRHLASQFCVLDTLSNVWEAEERNFLSSHIDSATLQQRENAHALFRFFNCEQHFSNAHVALLLRAFYKNDCAQRKVCTIWQ